MRRVILLAATPVLFLGIVLIYPLISITRLGISQAGISTLLSDSYYASVFWFSTWQALLSTLLTLLIGLPISYIFSQYRFRGRRLLRALATVPFVLPTVVTAAGFTALFGSGGLLGDLARTIGSEPPQFIGTLGCVLLAHVFYNCGLVLRLVGGRWITIDPKLEQAAAMLGVSRSQTLLRITWPLLQPAIATAALLTFLFTFGSFGVILLLGGPQMATIEVEIYRQTTQQLQLPTAAALALLQAATTLIVGSIQLFNSRQSGRANLRSFPERLRPAIGWQAKTAIALCCIVLFLLIAPLPALALRSVTLPQAPGLAAEPTFAYYQLLNQNRRGSFFYVPPLQALLNSFGFALSATLLAFITGLPTAYLLAIKPSSSLLGRIAAALLNLMITIPLGVSAVMLGLGYILAWGPLGILGSPWLIPIAHALLAFPFVVRSIAPAIRALGPQMAEAARMLGARPARHWFLIELPLLSPALTTAAVLAFTASLGEFGAALLLARPEFPTVPMVIGRLLVQPGAANYGQALALSSILMVSSITGFLLLERVRPDGVGEI